MTLECRNPGFELRVRSSFARQAVMHTIGATLGRVEPGAVDIVLLHRDDLTQQHGFLHAGVVTTVIDSACGYAALTLVDPGAAVLSVEFTIHLLAPARGAWFRAAGRVAGAGPTLMVVAGEVHAFGGEPTTVDAPPGRLVAMFTGTMMTVRDCPALSD